MSNTTEKPASPNPGPATPSKRSPENPRSRRRWGIVALVAIITFFTGAVTAGAFGGGPFGGHHRMKMWHAGGFMSDNPDPAVIGKRVTRMMKHLSIEIDASPEQQDKLVTVATGAIQDLLPLRQSFRDARSKARELLLSPNIDRAAIEKLRAEQITRADQASKRVVQALGDAAEVLTPEQRQKIGKRIERFKHFRKRWFRG